MRPERYVGALIASFFFPGFGQGLVRRRLLMLVLALADVAIFGLALWSVWMLPVGLALRIVATIDAGRRMRQPQLTWDRTLPAMAVVLGAIGIGYVQLETTAFVVPTSSMYPTVQIGDHVFIDKLSFTLRPPRRGELIAFHHPCEPERVYLKRVVAVAGDTVELRCSVLYINGTAISDTLIEGSTCSYDDVLENGRIDKRPCSRYRQTLDSTTFDTFDDPDRPTRATEVHFGRDFPQLDGLVRPPSCATQMDGEPLRGTNQARGTVVDTRPASGVCAPQVHYVVPERSLFTLGDNRWNSSDSRYWGAVPLENVIGRVIGNWWPASRFGAFQ